MEVPLLRKNKRWNKHPLRPLWKTHLLCYPGAKMTPGKMTMFKEYKRVLTKPPGPFVGARPTFSLKSTPDGYLLIRDSKVTQRVNAKQAAILLNHSEPAQ